MDNVDLYCERIGVGFWAEPINAISNISFILAAYGAWNWSRRSAPLSVDVRALLVASVAIGLGSFTFHTMATSWARLLDVLPILIFELLLLWFYVRRIVGFSKVTSSVALAGFLAATQLGRQFPSVFNGSLGYAPAIIGILLLGLYHVRRTTVGRFDLLAAAGVLAVSLFFRTIDNAVCTEFPYGTHFLWHILNGLVVFLAIRAFVRCSASHQASACVG